MTWTLILVLVFCLLVDVHSSSCPQGLISSPRDWPRPVLVLVLALQRSLRQSLKVESPQYKWIIFVVFVQCSGHGFKNVSMCPLSNVHCPLQLSSIEMLHHRPVLFCIIFFIFRNDVTLALVLCYSWNLVLGCFELISFILWHCVETMTRS